MLRRPDGERIAENGWGCVATWKLLRGSFLSSIVQSLIRKQAIAQKKLCRRFLAVSVRRNRSQVMHGAK